PPAAGPQAVGPRVRPAPAGSPHGAPRRTSRRTSRPQRRATRTPGRTGSPSTSTRGASAGGASRFPAKRSCRGAGIGRAIRGGPGSVDRWRGRTSGNLKDALAAEVLRRVESFGPAFPFREGRMVLPASLGVDLVSRFKGAIQQVFL